MTHDTRSTAEERFYTPCQFPHVIYRTAVRWMLHLGDVLGVYIVPSRRLQDGVVNWVMHGITKLRPELAHEQHVCGA